MGLRVSDIFAFAILLYLLFEEIAGLFVSVALEIEIHSTAGHSLVEIYFVAVEVRAVNASKLGNLLTVNVEGKTATAAHACAVDHDGVHGNGYGSAEGLCGENYELHHDQRTDGDDHIELFACFKHFLERNGNVAVLAVGAVVCHNAESVGACSEFILKDKKILVSEADDGGNLSSSCVKSLSDGHCDCAANAAADDTNLLEAFKMCCNTERTNEILNGITLVKVIELFSCSANDLENDLNCSFILVGACNGERDSLAVFVNAKDYELTGLCLFSNKRCLDFHKCYRRIEDFFCYNSVHNNTYAFYKREKCIYETSLRIFTQNYFVK